jgi:hypothetical protein
MTDGNRMKLPSFLRRYPRAFWISTCNVVGLLFSVAGVILLFWYALPNEPPGGPTTLTGDGGGGPQWEAEMRRYDWYAHTGLVLVLIGTAMEAVPPICTALGGGAGGRDLRTMMRLDGP